MRVVPGWVESAGLAGTMTSQPVMCRLKVATQDPGCPVWSVSAHARVHVLVTWVTYCHHVNGRIGRASCRERV